MPLPNIGLGLPQIVQMGNGYTSQALIFCFTEKLILLDAFPFVIKGFHSDNGSEYINKRVAKLLEKLLIEFTKSRARHTNDNALAERSWSP
jgi:transposase InsO family protein